MREEEFFSGQVELAFKTQKNKRRGRDAVVYETNFVLNTLRGTFARLEKTLRIDHNTAFLASLPCWREIMATDFEGRKTDHEICDIVIPLADKILSPCTFNNRKGYGSQAAINALIEQICIVSDGYTKPCRIIKLDCSGYFPNALWDYAEKVIDEVIDMAGFDEERTAYLKWLTMIAVHCNPAAHCEFRSPRFLWREHIKPEKSIITKPEGVGGAIGRLIWQTAMGLYINDIIIWLNEECGIPLVCFVDDIVLIVEERLHQYALALIPELRRRLAERNVRLNEKKFYDQPYQHGVEFLGSHIKPFRIILNDETYGRAMERLEELNAMRNKRVLIDKFQSTINSYTGLLKTRTSRKRINKLHAHIDEGWYEYLEWNEARSCLVCRPEFTINERLNKKYNLNLRHHDTGRKKLAA